MTKQKIAAMFKAWLAKNQHRFPFKIISLKRSEFRFEGIAQEIQFGLQPCSLMIAANIGKVNWDFLQDFDVYPRRKGKLFFCSECARALEESGKKKTKARQPKMFSTVEELYIDHMFEPFLKWAKKHLKETNAIRFLGGAPKGWSDARIVPIKKLPKIDGVFRVIPVVPHPDAKQGDWGSLLTSLNIKSKGGKTKRLYVL